MTSNVQHKPWFRVKVGPDYNWYSWFCIVRFQRYLTTKVQEAWPPESSFQTCSAVRQRKCPKFLVITQFVSWCLWWFIVGVRYPGADCRNRKYPTFPPSHFVLRSRRLRVTYICRYVVWQCGQSSKTDSTDFLVYVCMLLSACTLLATSLLADTQM